MDLLTNSKSGHSGLLSSKSGRDFSSQNRGVLLVRQTRDILIFADQSSTSLSDSKREEKARKDATQIVANLQRQQVNSSYENTDMALHYGVMLRECIRHQTVADAAATFKVKHDWQRY
uniref:Uncharacterized protein n=1 Tax=Salix viminalis TaxID=40686 RepID=A0A6N2N2S2_SALVM